MRDYEMNSKLREDKQVNVHLEALGAKLLSRVQSDYTESANLEKAMEQVEDNLICSTKGAINPESTTASLKKEINSLFVCISITITLENVDKIDDHTKDFVADFDEDNAAVPAL
ncbi:hypothetical protein TSAR_007262 [Trichomalopsis sarcophagae]|uniref:Uncharacterized protein n=1 Tax=Trichomalopsis sarcophagae TaxID=543379 RepID=A0A232EGF6_9HYME|nr:hypothetical protein TSAR_007262 [Trichomalopsis sarcophagae]